MPEPLRVLIISYLFAPIGGVGTERCRKFVKYLPDFGWAPVVVSQDLGKLKRIRPDEIDEATLEELPDEAEVVRVDGPVLRHSYAPTFAPLAADGSGNEKPKRLLWLRRVANVLLSPDHYVLWVPAAVPKVLGLLSKRNCDVIFATGPSFSAFPLAALLSLLGRRPLVLDYRDPWGENGALFGDRALEQRFNQFLERRCLKQSSRVVFATEGFRRLYAEKHPDLAERFEVIQNGYDREPVDPPTARTRSDGPFRIGYAGKMFGDQYPMANFFRAVADLVARQGRDALRLEMAGRIDPANEALIEELGLGDIVELRGSVARAEVDALQQRSDALLLVIGDTHPFLYGLESAKLFEYLPLRRPILGLVPEGGAAWSLLEKEKLGPLAPPRDTQAIGAALDVLLGGSTDASAPLPPASLHRRELTRKLSSLFRETAQKAN